MLIAAMLSAIITLEYKTYQDVYYLKNQAVNESKEGYVAVMHTVYSSDLKDTVLTITDVYESYEFCERMATEEFRKYESDTAIVYRDMQISNIYCQDCIEPNLETYTR